MSGLFVTGTDTDVGKTVVSAALLHRFRRTSRLCYWKPVQTGFPEDDDTATVERLGLCSSPELCAEGVRLPRPLSPHLSAGYSGTEIHLETLLRPLTANTTAHSWIVEGAGGVMVPLNASQFMVDLIAALRLPALIVARSRLGTINHTLLSLSVLRARFIPVAGVVLTGEPNADNRRSIETYGNIPVLAEMPHFSTLTADALGDWARAHFDPNGTLDSFLAKRLA
jgi:dethiobiotin synthetase